MKWKGLDVSQGQQFIMRATIEYDASLSPPLNHKYTKYLRLMHGTGQFKRFITLFLRCFSMLTKGLLKIIYKNKIFRALYFLLMF